MSVLILHSDKRKATVFASNIKAYTNQKTLVCTDVDDAVKTLEKNESIKSVVAYCAANTENLDKLSVIKEKLNRSFEIYAINAPQYKNAISIKQGEEMRDVIRNIAKSSGITAKEMANLELPEFFEYSKDILVNGDYPVEIFDLVDNAVYTKISEPGAPLDVEKIKSPSFYVKSVDRLKVLNFVSKEVVASMDRDAQSVEESVANTDSGYNLVHLLTSMGIDKETQKLTDATAKSMLKTVSKSKVLKTLLSKLLADKTSFRYVKDMTTLHIGSMIIDKAEWGNKEIRESLAYVCLLSDISLSSDEQAMIASDSDLLSSKLSGDHKEQVMNHAAESAKIAAQFDKIPLGVESIIKQHHGNSSGIGFVAETSSLTPLALIYMMSEDVARKLILTKKEKKNITAEEIYKSIEDKYSGNSKFKQYFRFFSEISRE